MNSLMRNIFTHAVNSAGVASALRALFWRDRVAVLLYHDPRPETLDAHFQYLQKFADFVPMSQVNSPGKGRPRIAVTFDDGHVGNAALLPIFIKYGVRPTIYLCSSIVAQERMHWFLHPAAAEAGIARLIRMRNKDRLAVLRAKGFQQHQLNDAGAISGLSGAQIEAMKPYVDFESHTRFHPTLTLCEDDECRDELTGSKIEVERLTGARCEHFAYPYGIYGAREVEILRSAGYKTARTTDVGWNNEQSDPFRLKAFDLEDDSSVPWLVAQLTGITLFPRYLRLGKIKFLWARLFDRPGALEQGRQ